MLISVKPLPEARLRCTTKLVSSFALSFQLRLTLLEESAVADKPVGALGTGIIKAPVVANASLENLELPVALVA